MNKDYYEILGINKKAPKEEIKKAFRTLAHKYHPDKKTGDDAKFKEINEAYSVLSDDKKRAEYDSYGQTFSGAGGGQSGGFGGGQGFGDFDFSQFTQGGQGGGFEFDLGDIFGNVFGGGSRAEKGSELVRCDTCNGKGQIREVKRTFFGQFEQASTCDVCRGTGKVPKVRCRTCGGKGILKKETEVKIKIPAGIDNGEMMRLTGAGEAIAGGTAGDLYIKIYVKKHPTFRKDGSNLVMDLNVRLTDAILGGEQNINTLDGAIKIKIPEGVTHGEILRIKGKGVPNDRGHRGDILIKLHIGIPKKLSKEAKRIVEELKKEGI